MNGMMNNNGMNNMGQMNNNQMNNNQAPQGNGQIPKFCPNCGTATNGANFCSNCGNKLA